jgi:hypothetical protein
MSAEPVVDFVFTEHARVEMVRRLIDEGTVRGVLAHPEQRFEVRPGRHVLQSRVPMGDPQKAYLVRVFVDIDRTPCAIVTAYRTSRIEKYWKEQS